LKERRIPRTISTQHPDNVSSPPWSDSEVIEGEAELREAFFAYNDLGCDEVMWDSEGKDVDNNVVRKLFSSYPDYFQKKVIGEDLFLTYRVPNPQIETAERKIVTTTLETIPLSSDVATVFYNRETVPVFEVILPFTTSGKELALLHDYYGKAIAGVQSMRLSPSMTVKGWMGEFRPKEISVIPLVEDMEHLLLIDGLLREYLSLVKPSHMRVFIARSDPALNYGLIPAVLLAKIALSKIHTVEESTGVEMHPMIGVGSMPFRGHLSPTNVGGFLDEYRGLSTVTVQSAFRYDYPLPKVREAISTLNSRLPDRQPMMIEEEEEKLLRTAMYRLISSYQSRIEELAPFINSIAQFVPRRRARKLHIGLFGYSRNVKGKAMPRAIPFAAAFYSIGIPPEFIGASALSELTEAEWNALDRVYVNLKKDLRSVGSLVSWQTINMLMEMHPKVAKVAGVGVESFRDSLAKLMADLTVAEEAFSIKLGPRGNDSKKHENFTNNFLISYVEREDREARDAFDQAAKLRRSLG
jgi:phosphoenolpyruvate carboxylase